jgi:hypothetical protein
VRSHSRQHRFAPRRPPSPPSKGRRVTEPSGRIVRDGSAYAFVFDAA